MSVGALVVVDTGVWSAFFSKPGSREKRAVDLLLDQDRVAVTGPVLAEVLRGFRRADQADWVASRQMIRFSLEHCQGLLKAHTGKPFQELVHRCAAFEIFEQGLHRHARSREHPRAAHLPRNTLNRRTLRPIQHAPQITPCS